MTDVDKNTLNWAEICNRLSSDSRWPKAAEYLTPAELAQGIDNIRLFNILDRAWDELRDGSAIDEEFLARYYSHPVWLINAAFCESDPATVADRAALIRLITHVSPRRALDFGGGFGISSRLCAELLPSIEEIALLDLSSFAETVAKYLAPYPKIKQVNSPERQYDAVICAEVFEHLIDPIDAAVSISKALRIGGAFTASWSFAAGPKCHLPQNFHLRRSMVTILRSLGFGLYGFERRGSTVWGFVKTAEADSARIRRARLFEKISRLGVPLDRLALAVTGI